MTNITVGGFHLMRTLYAKPIHFTIEHIEINVMNIVYERFQRSIPTHSHGNGSYEIHYIPTGKGTATIEEKNYSIIPGTLFMTGPNVLHSQYPDKSDPMGEYCIYLNIKLLEPLQKGSFMEAFVNTFFWFGHDTQDMHPLMQQLFHELEQQYTGYTFQAEALLKQCIIKMVRNYQHRQESKKYIAPPNIIDRNYIIAEECFLYESDTITLVGLANRLGLSTRQTERFLQNTYGRTFLQKKTEARMFLAAIRLSESDQSITEIAFDLGYSSAEHFSHAFKKYYKTTARQYRKEHK